MEVAIKVLWVTIASLLLRAIWMKIQARRAIRQWLSQRKMQQVRIRGATLFRNCGSVRNALIASLTQLDFDVIGRYDKGYDWSYLLTVELSPVLGFVKGVRVLSEKRLQKHKV